MSPSEPTKLPLLKRHCRRKQGDSRCELFSIGPSSIDASACQVPGTR